MKSSISTLNSSKTPRDAPTCDFWKREGLLTWTTDSDSGDSDSDCEEQDLCTYKVKKTTPTRSAGSLVVSASWSASSLALLGAQEREINESACTAQQL